MSHLDELFAGYPEHLSVQELTELLGVKKSTIYSWLQQGTIPAYRVGGSWVVLREEVKDLMRSGRNLAFEHDSSTPDGGE